MTDLEDLIEIAESRLGDAYAPHSNFHVGAALLTENGEVYTGVNIENDNYTNTRHAEEVAIMKAVDEGHREFTHLAVATEDRTTEDTTVVGRESPEPCGSCKQTITQFIDGSIKVILGRKEDYRVVELSEEFQL